MSTTSELILTGGDWSTVPYKYVTQDVAVDYVIYVRASMAGAHGHSRNNISYTQSTGLWSQLPGNNDPYHLNTVDSYETSSGQSVSDSQTIYGYDSLGTLIFVFDSPWYEAPTPPNTNSEGSTSSCHLTYDPVQNWMQAFLNATLDSTDLVSTRNLYYRVRNATTNTVVHDMNHTSGTHTYLNFDPTVNGTYELQKVLTNPLEVLICDSAVVNTFPASDDPPENDPPPSPIFVTRSARRGNLNFW